MSVVNPNIESKESDWKMVLPRNKFPRSDVSLANSDVSILSPSQDGRLFVGGLHWQTTEDSLRSYFKQFGPLKSVVMIDGRGFGFVVYKNAVDAQRCLLNKPRGHAVDNKIVDVKPYGKQIDRTGNAQAHTPA
mmetsp:Transcript_27016/g.48048  ORF Transcript_27016/g.48048 Transcript_27016/m.48048 type:complete len:133 (+) Transcript_27016:97-495(+)